MPIDVSDAAALFVADLFLSSPIDRDLYLDLCIEISPDPSLKSLSCPSSAVAPLIELRNERSEVSKHKAQS